MHIEAHKIVEETLGGTQADATCDVDEVFTLAVRVVLSPDNLTRTFGLHFWPPILNSVKLRKLRGAHLHLTINVAFGGRLSRKEIQIFDFAGRFNIA